MLNILAGQSSGFSGNRLIAFGLGLKEKEADGKNRGGGGGGEPVWKIISQEEDILIIIMCAMNSGIIK